MIYTALGDSITFGENASSFANAYPQLAVSALHSSSHKATCYVMARPGWTSHDLLDSVIWRGASMIRPADVVSIWIGGVDLANAALISLRNQQPLAAKQMAGYYRRHLGAIVSHIKKGCHARIVFCTQYNPFPNSPLAAESVDQLNRITRELAQSYDVGIAPVHTWFEGKQANLIYGYRNGKIEDALSGSLPIHPNDKGHQVIAAGLAPYLAPRK
ncbi:SGNH/GDSL hydrolase family protein [Paenibacillus planticolens]|uniref:SGNH/GDSL hydrolase family protein n=1 Tax=Paenibacillus planticolens TaxID=2654976 RepID=A0ABX1ZP69_9BACL|nr:SGNH/GDSL hydrolase family protein [Paenibacillus planticolens]NOV01884.1 SGNH/GDSL hydrolase family protein [Paenibacillus planticolens]